MTLVQWLLAVTFVSCLVHASFLASTILFARGPKPVAPWPLAAMLLCFIPMLGEEFASVAGLSLILPHVIGSSLTVDYLLAPLLYLYARSLIEPSRDLGPGDARHLAPFAMATLAVLPFHLTSGTGKLATLATGLPLAPAIVIAGKAVVGGGYLAATIVRLRHYLRSAPSPSAHARWFLRTLTGLAITALMMVAFIVWPLPGPIDADAIGAIFMCLSTYLVSFVLLRHPPGQPVSAPLAETPTRPKYVTSPLRPEHRTAVLERLTRHMETARPHLDMHLTLDDLAGALRVPPAHLSQVLNEGGASGFYDFVNGYRVRESQARIATATSSGRTLLAVAHEAGFASKASFNRAFKRATGVTPSEYARMIAMPTAPAYDATLHGGPIPPSPRP